MIAFAIGMGMVLSWLCFELFGVSAGGLVVPGYLAFFLHSPQRLLPTFGLAYLVVALLKLLQRYLALYGRRRFMATVLIGFTLNALWRQTAVITAELPEFYAVGFIIPGLLAHEMDRHGIIPTTLATLAIAAVVRICLGWIA